MSLQFDSVTRRYGDLVALNRVSFEVGEGITALVGPNGSGKSTFMRLATAHSQPTTGTVSMFGEPVWGNHKLMRRVGYVPEQDAFYEHMSGVEFVASLAQLRGYSSQQAKSAARAELRALGLDEGLDRPIKGYSKGMRQRVKLAQALVHNPDLILLDEPLLGCDPIARRRIQERVLEAAKAGASILVSSHILPEVERLTQRIGFLQAGRLIASGNAMDIREELTSIPSRLAIRFDKARPAAASLVQWEDVNAVKVDAGQLVVETNDVSAFLHRFQSDVKPAWGYQGHKMLDGDLSSVFGYLSGGGR